MELHPKSPKELHSQNNDANNKIEVPKKKLIMKYQKEDIYHQKIGNKSLMN